MKMNTIRNSILCLSALFLAASLLHGQDLSKYRDFSLGMSLPELSSQVDSFALFMFSKRPDAQVEAALAKSIKLEGQEESQEEMDRQKKETDDLEAARQKNRRIFRP